MHMKQECLNALRIPFANYLKIIHFENLTKLTRNFNHQIKYIQSRMVCKKFASSEKINILRNEWDKMFFNLMKQATKLKDAGMQAILNEIVKIKPEIK